MRKTPVEWKKYFESDLFEQTYCYGGDDLGCTWSDRGAAFRIWAPTAEAVSLNLYRSGNPGKEDLVKTIAMERAEQGTWLLHLAPDVKNLYYTYTVCTEEGVQETQDPYARACGVNGKRSMVVDLEDTCPERWHEDTWQYDAAFLPVIYELHIKDFSFAGSSGIPEAYRGKYKAFTVADATLNGEGEKPTGLAYLKTLGITHVHLLPCFDFGSVDEAGDLRTQFNWGYDPVNYNVPEGSYATDAEDGRVRIREFKEMVQSLHEAGIGVIMDVVYNHTHSSDSCFQKTVPYYYYRFREDGTWSDGSICGNDTASEHLMYRKYMADSVCYWAKEYHIDGFRFDLMGLHDVETMNEICRRLRELPGGSSIFLYGEPWSGTETAMKDGAVPAVKKNVAQLEETIAIFNDDTRDAIKGSVRDARVPGFVNGRQGMESAIRSSVLAWCDGAGGYQPHGPGQTITYVSAHDNWTLWDKLNLTLLEKPDFAGRDEEILKANRFAAGIVMTSLGTVFFQAGEEAARTKMGDGNSFASSPELNALDWERMYRFEDLMQYYREMLKVRRTMAVYRKRGQEALEKIRFYETDAGIVAFSVDADSRADAYRRLWVIYNAKKTDGAEFDEIRLPESDRRLLSDGKQVYPGKEQRVTRTELVRSWRGQVTVYGEEWEV